MARSKKTVAAKLAVIEENMFFAGNKCVEVWCKTGNQISLRMAVSTYRTSMQAMRDQTRYRSSKKR